MENTKTAFICITGAPNVGKSSILNKIIGEKIAIVSSKPQTTRTSILGIYTHENVQLVFTDTPGLMLPRNALGRHMVSSIDSAEAGSDIVMLVVEASKKMKPAELSAIEKLKKSHLPAILLLNKIDVLDKKALLMPQMEEFSKLYDFSAIIPVCALNGDGIKETLRVLSDMAQPGPFLYEEDEITNQPERELAAEYVREQILKYMQQEIPHGVAVVIDKFTRGEESLEIDAVIFCERENHKGMIIGRSGSMLKQIRKGAEKTLKLFFDCPVELNLWVRVKENWRDNEYLIKNFGLDFKGEDE